MGGIDGSGGEMGAKGLRCFITDFYTAILTWSCVKVKLTCLFCYFLLVLIMCLFSALDAALMPYHLHPLVRYGEEFSSRRWACFLPSGEPWTCLAGLLTPLMFGLPRLTNYRRDYRGLCFPSLFTIGRGIAYGPILICPYFFLTILRALLVFCATKPNLFPEFYYWSGSSAKAISTSPTGVRPGYFIRGWANL